ncbi:MAG: response regulator [Rhodospirillaceae bacterium]|jgi:DNA-binding response OmpR family regulator|nr:response regulator [Rhodospirillaceae bacterium]MBT3884628.1 response regulator [Rhodospirillaceae bacterium]MBT4117486.1 response regulator [Rhodospirillaceae bacterium]MBT4672068.1 response regulator [Rhodospirillaceae bacterium]MBT4720739.1 response regulator [Rhodospirillaceae bacterium]
MNENYNIEQLHFLVVDDNKHMSMLVKNLLHALGSRQVAEANDAADAFAELTHFPADIIITDYHMQPLDGLDFVRLVRTGSDSPNPFVPIIMLSGHTEMKKIMEARDAGAHEYLAKPISARSLYARINSIISRPREFIKTKTFFGPDRRRRAVSFNGSDRRVADASAAAPGAAAASAPAMADAGEDAGLSQDELDALFD